MRTTRRLGIIAAAGALGAILILPAQGRRADDTTRAFSIDGLRFVAGDGENAGTSLVERELKRLGVTDPLPVETLREVPDLRKSTPLRQEERAGESRISLPRGLSAGHTLALETEGGRVEVVTGTLDRESGSTLTELSMGGWTLSDGGEGRRLARLAAGKETILVLLEEREGRFLYLRRVEE